MQRFHRKLFSLNLLSGICVLPRCSNQHSQMTLQNRSLSGCRLGGRCHQERHYILGKKPHIHYLNRQLLQSSLYFPYSFNRSRWFDLAHEFATRSRCFNRSRWFKRIFTFLDCFLILNFYFWLFSLIASHYSICFNVKKYLIVCFAKIYWPFA